MYNYNNTLKTNGQFSNAHQLFNKMLDNKNKIVWPEPESLQQDLLPVLPLSPQLIPPPLQAWIIDIAERMQCPIDYIAVAIITVIGALIGTACGIKPKQFDDWLVIPNLWGGIIGRPGMLKTPAISEVMQLLGLLEAEAKQDYDREWHDYQVNQELYKAEKEALKNQMLLTQKNILSNKNNASISIQALKERYSQLQEPTKPIWKRYKTNDATIEKLHELLNENPRGLLLYRDELMGLLAAWEKEGRESDRAFFLEAWNGYGSHTTDRIGRGTVHTANLCLSIFGSTQPTKLINYFTSTLKGYDNDGLLQRFQLLVYPDEIKHWQLIDRKPNHQSKQKVFNLLKTIATMDFMQSGAVKEDSDRIVNFHFDKEAQQFFYLWLTELEQVKLKQDLHPILLEHLAKYRSLMPTLALIFHVIDIADGKSTNAISLQAALNAAGWCGYLESHAKRIYGLAGNTIHQAAVKLASKLQQAALPTLFSLRDVYRKDWGVLSDKETAYKACEELVEAGWLIHQFKETSLAGRPKSPSYLINPKISHLKEKMDQNGQPTT